MKYHELELSKNRKTKRVGRGISAGQGKTAGRVPWVRAPAPAPRLSLALRVVEPTYAGPCQNCLALPATALKHNNVYTGQLDALKAFVDAQVLAEAGLIASAFDRVKFLNKGDVKTAVTVKLGCLRLLLPSCKKLAAALKKVPAKANPLKN